MRWLSELQRCRPWIEAALDHGGNTHGFEDIEEGIAAGRLQFWPAPEGCIVTEILQFPRRRALNVFLGGGDMDQLLDMHGDVIRWARDQGCDQLMLCGRRGWERALKSRGWKPTHITMTRDLE